jgi:inorganic pyrophosphatase
MLRVIGLLSACALLFNVSLRAFVGGAAVSPHAFALDDETIVGVRHYVRGYPPTNADGSVNAVIEIPTGTTAKFEVNEHDGLLHWQRDREHGGRREIDYLPFLVNYGMVPRTLAPDGDPLDIVVLARAIDRGHVARVRVIGVLKMLDRPDDPDVRDDKLLGVAVEPELRNGFSELHDLADLDERYTAVRAILETWFSSYWGAGRTRVLGWGDAAEAAEILEAARQAFTEERPASRVPLAASAPRHRAELPSAVLAR